MQTKEKEPLLAYVARTTQNDEDELRKHSFNWIIDSVVLAQMAGQPNLRWCITDDFMNFVAKYINEIKAQSSMTAELLLEIALQRVLRGAVIVPSPTSNWSTLLNKLPRKYSYYSSFWDEEHIMTNGCYNFIMTALENGFDNAKTKEEAADICFGLMAYISPDGKVSDQYYYIGDFKDKALQLYRRAQYLVEAHLTFEEIFPIMRLQVSGKNTNGGLLKTKLKSTGTNFFNKSTCRETGLRCGGKNAPLSELSVVKRLFLSSSQSTAKVGAFILPAINNAEVKLFQTPYLVPARF